jgi:hypothetical protein
MAMTRNFLSRAREADKTYARRLHADLTSAGFVAWFDRESMPSRGHTFRQEIRDAIAARDWSLLVAAVGECL